MKGYKQMIRDRMPENWVFVLKYFKALGKWINLVYNTRVRPWNTDYRQNARNANKSKAVKDLFDNEFIYTIDHEKAHMSNQELENWRAIFRWIEWFNQNYLYIKQEYLNVYRSREENLKIISKNYTHEDKLTNAIANYIDNGEKA